MHISRPPNFADAGLAIDGMLWPRSTNSNGAVAKKCGNNVIVIGQPISDLNDILGTV